MDYLAYEVHPHPNGRSHIGGRSLVDVTETLEIVTDVTMMGLLISICKLFGKYVIASLYWSCLT